MAEVNIPELETGRRAACWPPGLPASRRPRSTSARSSAAPEDQRCHAGLERQRDAELVAILGGP